MFGLGLSARVFTDYQCHDSFLWALMEGGRRMGYVRVWHVLMEYWFPKKKPRCSTFYPWDGHRHGTLGLHLRLARLVLSTFYFSLINLLANNFHLIKAYCTWFDNNNNVLEIDEFLCAGKMEHTFFLQSCSYQRHWKIQKEEVQDIVILHLCLVVEEPTRHEDGTPRKGAVGTQKGTWLHMNQIYTTRVHREPQD